MKSKNLIFEILITLNFSKKNIQMNIFQNFDFTLLVWEVSCKWKDLAFFQGFNIYAIFWFGR